MQFLGPRREKPRRTREEWAATDWSVRGEEVTAPIHSTRSLAKAIEEVGLADSTDGRVFKAVVMVDKAEENKRLRASGPRTGRSLPS